MAHLYILLKSFSGGITPEGLLLIHCNYVSVISLSDPRQIFNIFTMTKFGESSVIVRFHFISSKDELFSDQCIFHFTRDSTDNNLTSWERVVLPFNETLIVTNETFDSQNSSSQTSLLKMENQYAFVIPNLTLGAFYYVRFELTFRENHFASQPFYTPTWVIRIPGTNFI